MRIREPPPLRPDAQWPAAQKGPTGRAPWVAVARAHPPWEDGTRWEPLPTPQVEPPQSPLECVARQFGRRAAHAQARLVGGWTVAAHQPTGGPGQSSQARRARQGDRRGHRCVHAAPTGPSRRTGPERATPSPGPGEWSAPHRGVRPQLRAPSEPRKAKAPAAAGRPALAAGQCESRPAIGTRPRRPSAREVRLLEPRVLLPNALRPWPRATRDDRVGLASRPVPLFHPTAAGRYRRKPTRRLEALQ